MSSWSFIWRALLKIQDADVGILKAKWRCAGQFSPRLPRYIPGFYMDFTQETSTMNSGDIWLTLS